MIKLFITYIALTCVTVLPALAFQTTSSKDKGKVEVRFLAERIPRNLGKVVLVNEELRSDPFDLPMNNLSQPQMPPERMFNIFAVDKNVSVASVKLPEEGKSFVVVLLPSAKDKGSYTPIVIPFDNPSFKGGDIYFHNNSNKPVLGLIGKTKMALTPGNGAVITPSGFGKERYYHVMLGVREAKGNKVIKSMKWPATKTMRNYVFFYVDPRKKRVTYRAVDEFILPKEKANP